MEIKRTVLPPYGGPREESGSNGSLWSMGGGIIGNATPEPLIFTVDIDFESGLFYGSPTSAGGGMDLTNETQEVIDAIPTNTYWSVSIKIDGSIIGTYVARTGGAAPGNPYGVNFQPSYGSDWNAFKSLLPEISYEISEITVNTDAATMTLELVSPPSPVAIIGPTANWLTWFSSRFIFPSTIYPEPETEWADIIANPTAYSLVIEGGPEAGTYPIGYASQLGPTAPGVIALSLASSSSEGLDIPDRLIGLEGAEMSYFVGNGWTPTAGTASIVLA